MKCDRCREQLPIGDGIDHHGQTLCLACCMQGAANPTTLHRQEHSTIGSKQEEQTSTMSTEFINLHV